MTHKIQLRPSEQHFYNISVMSNTIKLVKEKKKQQQQQKQALHVDIIQHISYTRLHSALHAS